MTGKSKASIGGAMILVAGPTAWYAQPPAAGVASLASFEHATGAGVHEECPHEVMIDSITEISIAGPITNVPEFHDCQRVIVDGEYGPVVALWVSVRIDYLLTDMLRPVNAPRPRLPFARAVAEPTGSDISSEAMALRGSQMTANNTYSTTAGGTLRTVVVTNPTQLDSASREFSLPLKAVPAVQIYNYGDAVTTSGAKLPHGFSCIYLKVDLAAEAGFSAWLRTKSKNECTEPRESTQGLTRLHVDKFVANGPYVEADYPPVTRWEWDEAGQRQVITVKCGAAMCRIGVPGAIPRVHTPPAWALGPTARVFEIPGWYDEQILSRTKPDTIRRWQWRQVGFVRFPWRRVTIVTPVPSGVLGTVFPDFHLEAASFGDFYEDSVRVSEVHLSAKSADYEAKFNFFAPAGGGYAAQKWIRHKSNHLVPPNVHRDDDWTATIQSAVGIVTRDVVYRTDENFLNYLSSMIVAMDGPALEEYVMGVPGTARWRWQESGGENEWEECTPGCCETIPPPPED
jgi:hypothetical protein